MKMEQPRVEFVEIQLDNAIVTSSGSSIGICQRTGDDYIDCTGTGYDFNYYGQEDCGGDTNEFDY